MANAPLRMLLVEDNPLLVYLRVLPEQDGRIKEAEGRLFSARSYKR